MLRLVGEFGVFFSLGLLLLGALGFTSVTNGQTVPGCGDLDRGYGPFDYTNPIHVGEYLPRVERAHFEPEIQRLEADEDAASIGANLDYVLGAFPNHHPALDTMSRYLRQSGDRLPRGVKYPMDCYFKRAVTFNPTDGMVRMLYGNYHQRRGEYEAAAAQYEAALTLEPKHPELHYNYGLLMFTLENYEEAMAHAKVAYASGFPLRGLRQMLESVGYWSENPE